MTIPATLVDDETTWPSSLRTTLETALPELREYEEVRAEYAARAENDLEFRYNLPRNPFQSTKDRVIADGNAAMTDQDIIGFHCARLHADDIESIRKHGLRPLSRDHLFSRIDTHVGYGSLSAETAAHLKANNQAADSNRSGMIWFCFTRSLLADESGVGRLFRSWGGEALYNSHERDEKTGPLLMLVGTPCIVEVRVPLNDVTHFGDIGERMRLGFLERREVAVENRGHMSGYVRTPLGAERIVAIHRLGDKAFNELTECADWRLKLA